MASLKQLLDDQAAGYAQPDLAASFREYAARVAALVSALDAIEGRVELASRAIHDSTRWDEEEMEEGVSIWDWIFADARAALSAAKE